MSIDRSEVQTQDAGVIHVRLINAVTEFDRRASKRKGYNRWALGHYMRAVDNAEAAMRDGQSLREALCENFNGRLLDAVLKAVGEPASTREEQRGW